MTESIEKDLYEGKERPLTADQLKEAYPADKFIIEESTIGHFIVIDRELNDLQQEADALTLVAALLSRPDPLSPFLIGDLKEPAKKAAIRQLTTFNPTWDWEKKAKPEDVGMSLSLQAFVRFSDNDRGASFPLPLRSGNNREIRDKLYSAPVRKRDVSQRELAARRTQLSAVAPSRIVCRYFGVTTMQKSPLTTEAFDVLHKHLEDAVAAQSEALMGVLSVLEERFSGQLGDLGLFGNRKLSQVPAKLLNEASQSLKANWQHLSFESANEADVFMAGAQDMSIKPGLLVTWAVRNSKGEMSLMSIELYRHD